MNCKEMLRHLKPFACGKWRVCLQWDALGGEKGLHFTAVSCIKCLAKFYCPCLFYISAQVTSPKEVL